MVPVGIFLLGICVGILIILILEYLIFFNPWAVGDGDPGFQLQFTPFRIPIELDLGLNIEYRGGFHLSVDVVAVLGRRAFLSMKVTRVAGQARLRLSRHPFTHWSFVFVNEPTLEFAVDSRFHGRPLPQLVPLIIQQFRRAVRRKHVLPHYKVRYRPFFTNPLMQASSNPEDFEHIRLIGALQIHIRSCSRLNVAAAGNGHSELFCQITIGKPFVQGSLHYVSMVVKFSRHSIGIPFGLLFSKISIAEKGSGSFIQVASVKQDSPGDRAGFHVGDVILAVNNLPITTEKQAAKLLNKTTGELVVLIDRKLTNIESEDDVMEKLVSQQSDNGSLQMNSAADNFVHMDYHNRVRESCSEETGSASLQKAHSESNLSALLGRDSKFSEKLLSLGDVDSEESDGKQTPLRKARSSLGLRSPSRKPSKSETDFLIESFVPTYCEKKQSSFTEIGITDIARKTCNRSESLLVTVSPPEPVNMYSSPQQAPPMTRRQRLTAKASEKAAKVAEKWTIGKGAVKGFWQKHHRAPELIEGFEVPFPPGSLYANLDSARMNNSMSVEVDLSEHRNCTDTEADGTEKLRPTLSRSRSHSEPDTTALVSMDNCEYDSSVCDHMADEIKVVDREKGNFIVAKDKKGSPNPTLQNITSSPELSHFDTEETDKKLSGKEQGICQSKETRGVPLKPDVAWEQTFAFDLDDKSRFLNVMVWSRLSKERKFSVNLPGEKAEKAISFEPVLIGYTSLFIPEILDDCSVTVSNHHEQTFTLRPPGRYVVPPKYQSLERHPGFDSRLCYGDIKVGFQWYPEGAACSLMNEDNLEGEILGGNETAMEPVVAGHSWVSSHFQQAVFCSLCQKKIWWKSASQCEHCMMICHKKCQPKADDLLSCGGHGSSKMMLESSRNLTATAGASDIVDLHAVEGAAEAVTVSLDDRTFRGSVGKGKRFQLALSERISYLRRRKPATASSVSFLSGKRDASSAASSWSYQDLLADEKIDQSIINSEQKEKVEVDSLDESLNLQSQLHTDPTSQFHTLLYTQGGTYNEHVIHAAKDLGKGLFSDLEIRERKAKINEQIDVLQKEIDAATQQRLDVLQEMRDSPGSQREKDLALDMTRIDDKLQALAVLMLHYCAGLQHCLDLEETVSSTLGENVKDEPAPEENLLETERDGDEFSLTDDKHFSGEHAASDQHNKELLEFLVSSQPED